MATVKPDWLAALPMVTLTSRHVRANVFMEMDVPAG